MNAELQIPKTPLNIPDRVTKSLAKLDELTQRVAHAQGLETRLAAKAAAQYDAIECRVSEIAKDDYRFYFIQHDGAAVAWRVTASPGEDVRYDVTSNGNVQTKTAIGVVVMAMVEMERMTKRITDEIDRDAQRFADTLSLTDVIKCLAVKNDGC